MKSTKLSGISTMVVCGKLGDGATPICGFSNIDGMEANNERQPEPHFTVRQYSKMVAITVL